MINNIKYQMSLLKTIAETNKPSPFPHLATLIAAWAGKVIQSEVISGLYAIAVPFETSAEAPLDVCANQFFVKAVVGFRLHIVGFQPRFRFVAQVRLQVVVFRQSDMQLRAGVEEQPQLFPQRYRVVRPNRDGQVMLQHAMGDILRLRRLRIHTAPVLLVLAVRERV